MSNDVKRMSREEAESFTSDQVTSAIKSCWSSRAYGPKSVIIFHLKNLGSLATEHLTTLYNDSLKSCRLPSIWSSRRSSYPLLTNFSNQLKINTASDPDIRLHLPSDYICPSSEQTSRQASTSGTTSPYSVCDQILDSCL